MYFMEIDAKIIMPIVTLIIGIFIAPLVERLKEAEKSNAIKKNLKLEIKDELSCLGKYIQRMAESLQTLVTLKENNDLSTGSNIMYVPGKTSCYFLKHALEQSFHYFSTEQRTVLRSMQSLMDAINENAKSIKETQTSMDGELLDEQLDERIKHCKHYIYTACCLRYNMHILLASSYKRFPPTTDQKIIDQQLSDLNIDFLFGFIQTKGKFYRNTIIPS